MTEQTQKTDATASKNESRHEGVENFPIPDGAIVFFHGKESGPAGTKYRYIKEKHSEDVRTIDFRGMSFADRLQKALAVTEGCKDLTVVGSSFGGLLASVLYSKTPERIRGYVLLAPALHLEEAKVIERVPAFAEVIHGVSDDIVPIQASRVFCEKYGVALNEVDDDHRLHKSLDDMLESLEKVVSNG